MDSIDNNDFIKRLSYSALKVNKEDDLHWIKRVIVDLWIDDKINQTELRHLIYSLGNITP